ncbi:MAG: hypothetical protein GQ564_11055 [Bacteroidales bacterium]|nr:hypothetical protein [Bacteroidales bacterium]
MSVSKKTTLFYCLCQEGFKDKAFEVFKKRITQNLAKLTNTFEN